MGLKAEPAASAARAHSDVIAVYRLAWSDISKESYLLFRKAISWWYSNSLLDSPTLHTCCRCVLCQATVDCGAFLQHVAA